MKNIRRPYLNSLLFVGFGIISYIVRIFLCQNPVTTEKYFSQGFFLWVRQIFDSIVHFFPFPPYYLFIILSIIWLVGIIFRKESVSFGKTILIKLVRISGLLGLFYGLFLWLWGYNYCRMPIEQHFEIKKEGQSVDDLRIELEYFTEILIGYRQTVNSNMEADISRFDPTAYEEIVRNDVRKSLHNFGYETNGNLNVRFLKPKGALMVWSTAGVYFPFVGECHVDAGLHPLQQIYVMAHEMGHGYGFGDEGTCNFISFLASENTENHLVQYACLLGYWRTLAANYNWMNPKEYAIFRKSLPLGIQNDLDAINETIHQYPEWMPKLRNLFYNQYLKAQGIPEGIENYNRVVMLVTNWRKRD